MRDCQCMPVTRLDYGTLGEATKTPQGGLAIPAHLTRAGVFTYIRDGKPVREWRSMSEVSRQDTLDSLKNAPLTVRHPREGEVRPDNYRRHAAGHVGADVRMDGDKTAATVYVQDKAGLDAIAAGWRDVSCGYNCDTDDTPGVVPAGEPDAGKEYDRKQRNILYNHNAIVPHGRAGTARLHLDAADNAVEESMEIKKVEIIGGTEYEVGTPPHADARKRQDAADAEVAKMRADFAETKGKLAAAQSRLDAIDADSKAKADKAEHDALVSTGAAVLGKQWKADGKDAAAITAEIITKQFPSVRLDEIPEAERPAFTRGLLATIKPATQRADAAQQRRPTLVQLRPAAERRGFSERYRNDAMDEGDGMCERPMAISRRKPEPALQSTMIENQR
jgi:hypothetical protein